MEKLNLQKLPPFLESNLQGIIIYNNNKLVYTNHKATDILGFTLKDIKKFDIDNIHKRVNKCEEEKTKHFFKKLNSTPEFEESIEVKFKTSSKDWKWLNILAKSVSYNNEKFEILNITDITERKDFECRLIENEKRYKNFIEQTSEGISYLHFKKPLKTSTSFSKLIKEIYKYGYIQDCNDSFAKMYGLNSRKEIIGKNLIDIHGTDKNDVNIKAFKELADNGFKVQNVITEEFDDLGQKKYFINNSIGIIENGLLLGIWGAQIDITERQKTEKNIIAAYRISEAANSATNLNDLYESIHHIVGTLMPADNFYIAIYDKGRDLITFPYFIDEYDKEAPQRKPGNGITEYVINSGKSLLATPKVIKELRANGNSIPFGTESIDWLGVPLKIKGETIGILAVQSYSEGIRYSQGDVEILEYVSAQLAMAYERKLSEESLRFSEIKSRAIIAAIPDLMFIQNYDGVYLEYHARDKNLLLFEPDEFLGKSYRHVLPSELIKLFDDVIKEAINTNEIQICKYPLEIKGNLHFFEARFITYDNDKILSTIRDITLQEKMMTELVEAKEKAEEMNVVKSNFLANMSHELRTPLHGILGFAQILSEEITDEELTKMVNVIYKSGTRLLETLNLLLNFSKTEENNIETVYSEVDINNLMYETLSLFKPFAESKNLNISYEITVNEIKIYTDERLLREILNNLINNAVKFTDEGSITVSCVVSNKENLIIKVKDTGIGIPVDKYEQIFQEFRQESEGLSRNFEGTGLGLTLTKRYVEILGGSINVESKSNIGTEFTVIIPNIGYAIKSSSIDLLENENINIIPAPSGKRKLLLVENDKVSAMLVKTFVKKLYDLDIVLNGSEALQLITKVKYDAILMDINLGNGFTGLETAQKIKKLKRYKNKPIIAVTAFAMEEDKEEFLKYGCTHYLPKPFEKDDLLLILNSALNN